MKTVAETWSSFAKTISPDASVTQRTEMRRAFYAGFTSALSAALEMAEETGDDDETGARYMEALWEECNQFALDVGRGLK